MAQQHQLSEPTDTILSSKDNLLRTLLNGLKGVREALNKDHIPTQESSSSSPQCVPVPQLLVPNRAFAQLKVNIKSELNDLSPSSLVSNAVGNSVTDVATLPSDSSNMLVHREPHTTTLSTNSNEPQREANGRFENDQLSTTHSTEPQREANGRFENDQLSSTHSTEPQREANGRFENDQLSNMSNSSANPNYQQSNSQGNDEVTSNSTNTSAHLSSSQQQPGFNTPRDVNAIPMSQTLSDNNPSYPQGQSSVPNGQEIMRGPINTLLEATSLSLNDMTDLSSAITQGKISSILEGFKKMLEKKNGSAGSKSSQETLVGHSKGGSSNSEGVDSTLSADGTSLGTLIEQPLMSVVKSEIIETDENNECSITGVLANNINFSLPKEYHGVTISLLDDTDDENEPVVKQEPNQEEDCDSRENNDRINTQNVASPSCEVNTSSRAEVAASNIVQLERREVNSEKGIMENETNANVSNSSAYPNYQQSNSQGNDEVTSNSMNTSAQLQHFMTTLEDIIHSTVGKDVARSKIRPNEILKDSLDASSQQSNSSECLKANNGKSFIPEIGHDDDQSSKVSKNSFPESIGVKQRRKPGPKPGFKRTPKEKVPIEIDQVGKNSSPASSNLKRYRKPGPKSKTDPKYSIPGTGCSYKSHTVEKIAPPQSSDVKECAKRIRKPSFKCILQEDAPAKSVQDKPLRAKKSLSIQKTIRSVNIKLDDGDVVINDRNNATNSKGGLIKKINLKQKTIQYPKPSARGDVKRSMINDEMNDAASFNGNSIDSSNEMDDGITYRENLSLRTNIGFKRGHKRGRKKSVSGRGAKRLKNNEGESVDSEIIREEDKALSPDDENSAESVVVETYDQRNLSPGRRKTSSVKDIDRGEDIAEGIIKEKEGKRKKLAQNCENKKETTQASKDKSSGDSYDDDDSNSTSDSSCTSVSESSDDADVEYVCKLCSKSYSRRSLLKKHMKTHYNGEHKKVEKNVMCKGCRRKFSDVTALQAHLLQRRYCFFDCTRAYWKKKESSPKTCRMCGKGQAKRKDLKKHSYRDLTCRLRFINLVLEHAKKVNNIKSDSAVEQSSVETLKKEKTKSFKGNYEKQTKLSLKNRSDRQLSEIPEQSDQKQSLTSYKCGSCGLVLETPLVFREHLNKNEKCKKFYLDSNNGNCPVKLNYCPLCSTFMPSQSKLLTHLCTGTERSVKCKVCLKVFADERALKAHQRMSSCGISRDKGMVDNASAKTGIENKVSRVRFSNDLFKSKPFICAVCNRSFKQIQELLDHSYSHTDQGQFDCLDCNMKFVRYNSLVSHMIWHERKLSSKEIDSAVEGPMPKKAKESSNAHKSKQLMKQVENNANQNDSNVRTESNTNMKRKKSILKGLTFSCFRCDQKFSTLSGRNEHVTKCGYNVANGGGNEKLAHGAVSSTLKGKPNSYEFSKCSLCKMIIKTRSFYNHIKTHQRRIISGIKGIKAQPLTAPVKAKCVICKKHYATNKILIHHIMLHKPQDIMKPIDKSFQFSSERQHGHSSLCVVESGAENVPLHQTEQSAMSPSHSGATRKVARMTYQVSCKLCHKKFFSVSLLKFHLKLSHAYLKNKPWHNYVHYLQETEQWACSGDNSFEKSKKKPKLKRTMKTSHAAAGGARVVRKYSCEICHKVLFNIPRHMEEVHGLPRAMFLKINRNSHAAGLKQDMKYSRNSVYNKESVQTKIEIDPKGDNIPLDVGITSQSVKECSVCGKDFSHAGHKWKHLFCHIKPSSVTLVKLDEIIDESPILFEDDTRVGDEDMSVDISIAGEEVEEMSFADENVLPMNVDKSTADETPVSFDVNRQEDSSLNIGLVEIDTPVDNKGTNKSSVQDSTVCHSNGIVNSDCNAMGGDNSTPMLGGEENSSP